MRSSRFAILSALAAALLVSACATAPKGPPPEVVWPLPPEKPRIRFVESISSSQDIEGRRSGALMSLITGAESITGMSKPYSVHVDREGRIFVPDTGWRKVLVFDPAGKKFWMLGVDGLGMLSHPLGVATDEAGHIYATDSLQ
ncbi:MAG: hypothetical protein OEY97_12220, partial [Nitrospirota bacterium]|nr:hypothetical protein [Nitrospirota bacterium]